MLKGGIRVGVSRATWNQHRLDTKFHFLRGQSCLDGVWTIYTLLYTWDPTTTSPLKRKIRDNKIIARKSTVTDDFYLKNFKSKNAFMHMGLKIFYKESRPFTAWMVRTFFSPMTLKPFRENLQILSQELSTPLMNWILFNIAKNTIQIWIPITQPFIVVIS